MASKFESQLTSQIAKLKEVSAHSTDTCATAIYIALSDDCVQKLFIQYLEDGNRYDGRTCLPGGFEQDTVVFNFLCPDGQFCIVNPRFAAVIDLTGGVMKIIDPYWGPYASVKGGDGVGNG